MRLFLRQSKFNEQFESDFNIISVLFKLFLISTIALLVFLLTAQTYSPPSFENNNRSLPEMLTANPPSPY